LPAERTRDSLARGLAGLAGLTRLILGFVRHEFVG
jgi:hypothetical protein